MIDLEKAQQIAFRMSQSTTGQESAEWLLIAILIERAIDTKKLPLLQPSNGRQPQKAMVELSYDR